MMHRLVTGWLAVLLAAPALAGGIRDGCIGDCDADGVVKVHEIIVGVRVALGELPDTACPSGGPGIGGIDGLVTAVRLGLEGCSSRRDFSGFTHFAFERQSGFGFCPPAGLFAASIEPADEGVRFQRSLLVAGVRGVDACLPDAWGDFACSVVRPDADRLLTADELRQVREAFSGVTLLNGPAPFCLIGIADPCVVTSLTWNGQSASDFICASPRLDPVDLLRLERLLAALPD